MQRQQIIGTFALMASAALGIAVLQTDHWGWEAGLAAVSVLASLFPVSAIGSKDAPR
jgi:hypothetical protein